MLKKSNLTSKQQTALDRLQDLRQETDRDLLWHHRVGEQVQRMYPADDRAYGRGVIEQLAREVGESAYRLWTARTFARVYGRSEVRALSKPSPTGFRITWWHMVHLLTLEDDDRLSLQENCREEEWSTRELRSRIKEYREPKGKGGRRFQKIESVESGLRQIIEESESWNKRFHEVWFRSESPAIPSKSAEYRSKKIKDLARKAVTALETLQSDVEAAITCLKPQTGNSSSPKSKRSRKASSKPKRK